MAVCMLPVISRSQSLFDDYSAGITQLDAAPYASLSLDALDYNPAGNVFLRNGIELSLSSLWPRWQRMKNHNTFEVKVLNNVYSVNRTCSEHSYFGVPNPSARFSWRFGDNALAFSYAHGESRFLGNGNTCFDETTQKNLGVGTLVNLLLTSLKFQKKNEDANQAAQQFGGVAPFPAGHTFPITLLSSISQYDCQSDKFSMGYTRRFDIGKDNYWEYVSLYGGLKLQTMNVSNNCTVGHYYIDSEHQTVIPMRELCSRYTKFYKEMANRVPEMADYFMDEGRTFDSIWQFCDTMFSKYSRNFVSSGWGWAAEIGFDWVRPYWNVAVKMEFGLPSCRISSRQMLPNPLPFKFNVGFSGYCGQWQYNIGGDIGIYRESDSLFIKLFGRQLIGGKTGDLLYGDLGVGVSWSKPQSSLELKGGMSAGFNKDVLAFNGYGLSVTKQPLALSPSFGIRYSVSSILTVFGGCKAQIPLCKKTYNIESIYDSDAILEVGPEIQVLIGFVAHIR